MAAGLALLIGGVTGEIFGGALTATGLGSLLGLPPMVVSTTLVVGGPANIGAGIHGLTQALRRRGAVRAGKEALEGLAEGAIQKGGRVLVDGARNTLVSRPSGRGTLSRHRAAHIPSAA